MNLRAWALLAAVLALPLSSGCVVRPYPPGDVTFTWSFDGLSCAMVPEVNSVRISIPGQALMNDGIYPCSTNGVAGIVLHSFAGGSYTFTIEGRDFNGAVLYTRTGSFIVNGGAAVPVDLAPVGGGGGSYAYMVWTFPPNTASSNPTCAEAGVADMVIAIDGRSEYTVPCSEGQTSQGSVTPQLTAGTHSISLSARNAQGYEYYYWQGTFTTLAGQSTSQQFDLDWAVGGAAVRWTLASGGVSTTCSAAGVTTVFVNFRDAQGNFVYSGSGDPQPCSAAGIVYSFLQPGTYAVFLQAAGSGTSLYQSDQAFPPSVTVQAGVFRQVSDGQNIIMNRTQ